jgi:hypothetical protein
MDYTMPRADDLPSLPETVCSVGIRAAARPARSAARSMPTRSATRAAARLGAIGSTHRASSVEDAVKLASGSEEAKYLSGGQTLLPTMKQRLAAPSDLVDLRHVAPTSVRLAPTVSSPACSIPRLKMAS